MPFCKDVKVYVSASLSGGNILPRIIAYLTKTISSNVQMTSWNKLATATLLKLQSNSHSKKKQVT